MKKNRDLEHLADEADDLKIEALRAFGEVILHISGIREKRTSWGVAFGLVLLLKAALVAAQKWSCAEEACGKKRKMKTRWFKS